MNIHKQRLYQAVLARISLGAVPVDGIYWLDPKDAAIPDAGTSKSPKPVPVPGRDWPPASLSWFLRRP
ncbi:MAG: hypothetical protein JWO52_4534 [Gammaproteobacteria bacterium]|jgi:hypothetical protein|nr:hypothetical protein [Gammaproteobacteria bacterium]